MSETKTAVGALVISTTTRRVLLNLRAEHKTHANRWSLWGGMVETGETIKDALIRELSEEIGISITERLYPFDIYESRDGLFKFYTFVCVVDSEFVPILSDESSAYAWFNFGTWPKPMHTGASATFCNAKAKQKVELIVDYGTK